MRLCRYSSVDGRAEAPARRDMSIFDDSPWFFLLRIADETSIAWGAAAGLICSFIFASDDIAAHAWLSAAAGICHFSGKKIMHWFVQRVTIVSLLRSNGLGLQPLRLTFFDFRFCLTLISQNVISLAYLKYLISAWYRLALRGFRWHASDLYFRLISPMISILPRRCAPLFVELSLLVQLPFIFSWYRLLWLQIQISRSPPSFATSLCLLTAWYWCSFVSAECYGVIRYYRLTRLITIAFLFAARYLILLFHSRWAMIYLSIYLLLSLHSRFSAVIYLSAHGFEFIRPSLAIFAALFRFSSV